MKNQPSVYADAFKAAFRHHPGGVSLITASGPHGRVALTATSVTSVNADPPLLAFSVSTISSSHDTLATADSLVVHLLDAEHHHLAMLGATSGIDRFADTSLWRTLPTGEPAFDEAPWLRAEVAHRLDTGHATLIVARVVETGGAPSSGHGLVYVDRTWHRIGEGTVHDPSSLAASTSR